MASALARIKGLGRTQKIKHGCKLLGPIEQIRLDRCSAPPINGVYSIIASGEEDHARMRRNLSHAFSDKALRSQESLIQEYVNLLVRQLDERAEAKIPIDIMRWYNYTTFDIITDLAFGEPLYCLRDDRYHDWVDMTFMAIKITGSLATRNKYIFFKFLDKIKSLFTDSEALSRKRVEFFNMAHEKVERRLKKGVEERPDFFNFIIQNQEKEKQALTRAEMDSNAVVFLVAGSETTATTLSGVTYLLLKHPETYNKLVHEIRSTFKSLEEIKVDEVNKLGYLMAVLQEGLRYYPAVPTGFPRVVPPGGGEISGHFIPEGTSVYISQYHSNHSPRNFKDPDAFVPERWMGDERYKDDNRETVNPFSFGPRNCLGKKYVSRLNRFILIKPFPPPHPSGFFWESFRKNV